MKSVQTKNFFWSQFFCIRTRKNPVFGHFSRSVRDRILHRNLFVLSEKRNKTLTLSIIYVIEEKYTSFKIYSRFFLLLFFCFLFFLFWIYIVFSFFADFFDRLSKQIFHKKNIWNFDELLNVKVAIIKKPVNWSALQTNWLVSIWWQLWRLMSQWIVWDLINNSSLLNPQILSDNLKNAITSLHLRIIIILCMK